MRSVLKYTAIVLLCLVAAVVLALGGLTLWLSPERLSALVNERGSEYLDADLRVSNLRFTLWSTFPRLCIMADSISVTSRSLDSIPGSLKAELPEDVERLGGCGAFGGAVDVPSLLKGEIRLHDVRIEDFNLNLVAVNDSLSNFDIFPSDPGSKVKIPRISANSISLEHPRTIAYRSLQSGLDGVVKLDQISLHEVAGKGPDTYDLDLSGRVRATVDSLMLLSDFPFSLDGKVRLRFDPFGISFNDYSIALGNIRSRATMNFEAGNSPGISDLSFNISSFHLMKLLDYLPPEILPRVEGLDADILVNASARLTKPYSFSSSALPSIEVTFSVPDGDMVYTAGAGDTYSARHIGLSGIFFFDGDNPAASYISIPGFRVEGEGIDLDLSARAEDLLGSPDVEAKLYLRTEAQNLARYFSALEPFSPTGNAELSTDVAFSLASYSSAEPEDVRLSGTLNLTGAGFRIPQTRARATMRKGEIGFSSDMKELTASTTRFPVKVSGKLSGLGMTMPGHTDLKAEKVSFNGRVAGMTPGGKPDSVSVSLDASGISAVRPGLGFTLKDLRTAFSLCPRRVSALAGWKPAPFAFADSAMLRRLPHTPELITFSLPDTLLRLLSMTDLRGTLALSEGVLRLRDYPSTVVVRDCDLAWTLDSVRIRRFGFRSGESSLSLSGDVSNLRRFMARPDRTSLRARLRADIDTLNINQLARAYETAVKEAGLRMSKADSIAEARRRELSYARQDTTALILPRNIDLSVEAKAKTVFYTNLDFSPLRTSLTLDNGRLALPDLKMRATFAGAGAGLIYDTSDISSISLKGNVDLTDLDLLKMYAKFPSIERNIPELVNLSGTLALGADFNLGIFPTMSADLPGFTARVNLGGRHLNLHQTHFIHKIARMMMIFSHDDIHIADIDIRGNIHDNLIELYPFDLDFSHYRLRLQGLNNFGGELYYHIGVDHSPIPIPFGIAIEGQFRHPRLRFTGASWHNDKAASITADVLETVSFNFVREARSAGKAFIHEAAKTPRDQFQTPADKK